MINLASELADKYLAESSEHLAMVEACLLSIEKSGARIDEEHLNLAVRAMHSIKSGASVFDLDNIGQIALRTEEALELIRSREMAPTPERVRVLFQATDHLREFIQNAEESDQTDIAEVIAALDGVCRDHRASSTLAPRATLKTLASGTGHAYARSEPLRVLLVEDDFASRLLLQTFLSRYGECHVAVNGREAVEAFRAALEHGKPYDLVCMDIMMPEMDGREAVQIIRALEEEHGILSTYGAKIVMTTAVGDVKEVIRCFQELCDAYLLKPIDLGKLLDVMKSYQLIQ